MLKQWQYFLLAVGFFTRIPMPNFKDFQETDLNYASKYFPLVGIIIGLLAALSFYIATLLFTQAIAVLISMAVTIYATGAFHEDGLADSADGLGGGWQREQVLTIMQDSRLGTYGAVALFLMLMAKFQVLSALHTHWVVLGLIAAHALSRLCAIWLIASLQYAKPVGKAKPLSTQINKNGLWLANFFGLLPTLLLVCLIYIATWAIWQVALIFIALLILLVGAVWWWWRKLLLRKLGGYTGDNLGALQQMTELAYYFAALILQQLMAHNFFGLSLN
ncbi:MAG: adenosylcobinamide-GDP ribazoletransferase [Bdellovibrio sp.]|nr:adenosylcobinamide-GDP ribazoletransferase [Methylotenera sp.]